jgi:poly-gamma-glutamate synthesis protein (capsule biosynthesis protein)
MVRLSCARAYERWSLPMTTLALLGDVMLGRGVNDALREMRPEDPWGDVLALTRSVDLRIVNLECAITNQNKRWARTPKIFHFRADAPAVAVLRAARIDACSLANNHVLDFEEEGLVDTIAHLDDAGIAHAGAGLNPEEAARPALLDATGAPVALLAFTDNEPSFAAERNKPGTNYLPVSMETAVLRRVEEAVGVAREAGAKTVVFSNHWGPNMVERPRALFRRFARAVIDRAPTFTMGIARTFSTV